MSAAPNNSPAGTSEPIAITEAVRVVFVAVLAVLKPFNIADLSAEQVTALVTLFGAVSVALSVFARMRSLPKSKVALTKDQADQLQQ